MLDDHDPSTISTSKVTSGLEDNLSLFPATTTIDKVIDNPLTKPNDLTMSWHMRWWFFGASMLLSIIWIVGMMILSMHAFDVSRNPFSLSISIIGLLPLMVIRRFADFLLPMDDKRFELEKIKIQNGNRTWHQWPKYPK